MNEYAGIWIDHRKAFVVGLNGDEDLTSMILSHVEKHPERGGDSPMKGRYEAAQVPADDSRQRALTGELDRYYDTVIAALRGYAGLLLLGPGEAKKELHARLVKAHLGARVRAVEPADKLSDRQIVARVRSYFGKALPRAQAPH
jgi:hypothetical protein